VKLTSASANTYLSMSFGSVSKGFDVRTYRRMSGVGSSVSDMTSNIFEAKSLLRRASDRMDTAL
jgi:hypothetical protein